VIVGIISTVLKRFRPIAPIDLPEQVMPCRWGYVPLKPYLVVDCDPHAEAILGLARTPSLNEACKQFAQRLKVQPVANTHGVVDARDVLVLGASPVEGQLYSGCAAAWLLMDRYLEPVDAAIYETIAHEGAPV
jgi:hypothetical protein